MTTIKPKKEESVAAPGEEDGAEKKPAEMTRKDMLAVMLAMLQLFLPAILGLILVGVVVALILH